MCGFKNFAIAGAGNFGQISAEELLRRKDADEIYSVAIMTHTARSHEDLGAKGAKIILVDYSSSSSLNAALSDINIDVVLSCIPETCGEKGLAEPAKEAGVKLIVPSDYASDPVEQTEDHPLYRSRAWMKQTRKELELPYTVFCTGMFSDMVLGPEYSGFLGFTFAKGEFTIPGSGTAPISWTSSTDIARFVGHVLVNLPREKLEWRIFRIEGDRISLDEIVSVWEKHSGKAATVSHRPRTTFEEAVQMNATDFISLFILTLDDGLMTVGNSGDLSNSDYPGWKSKEVINVLQRFNLHGLFEVLRARTSPAQQLLLQKV
ncbi:hypothetical protein ACEPAG_2288 [Sanghuangporus baumii]